MRFHNLTIFIMCLHEGDVHPMSPCIAQIGVFGPKPKNNVSPYFVIYLTVQTF